jgi:predicted MFS family arabinose efflux permease
MRTFHLSAAETGASYGLVIGAVSVVGLLCGGAIGGALARRSPRSAFDLLALSFVVAMLFEMTSMLMSSYALFMALSAMGIFMFAFYYAPTFATVQSLVDSGARSFAAAVMLFAVSGVGTASGAFLCGLLSDLLSPHYGENSLKAALLILSGLKLWGAAHYLLVGRYLARERYPGDRH